MDVEAGMQQAGTLFLFPGYNKKKIQIRIRMPSFHFPSKDSSQKFACATYIICCTENMGKDYQPAGKRKNQKNFRQPRYSSQSGKQEQDFLISHSFIRFKYQQRAST